MRKNSYFAWNSRVRTRLLMIAIAGALPVSGCTSSGLSSLTKDISPTASIKPARQSTYSSAYSTNSLAPVAEAPTKISNPTRLASLISPTIGSSDLLATPYGDVQETPESLAEQRITKLFPRIKHGTCNNGWGMQANTLDAYRYKSGDPYYIEIRMRNTPPLPIGHTYTAYGRLDEQGNKLDEHLIMLAPVGGFAGAGIAGAIPMPSRMMPQKTDCNEKPKAAYRVSLSAVQYEKLLIEVRQAKKDRPKYHLFAYNCNHFTSRISESVGIRTPSKKYTSSLIYMYDIIKENEGLDYKRRRG